MRRPIRRQRFAAAAAACLAFAASVAIAALSNAAPETPEGWATYSDPQGRFHFSYPSSFGTASPGTDSGFRDRVAAIRFSEFSSGLHGKRIVLGGEAALTKGLVRVDVQAAGGLYDEITLGAVPDDIRQLVLTQLTPLTPNTFCDALSRTQHVDVGAPALASLNAQQKQAIAGLDRMRNLDPKVLRCEVSGQIIVFHKEVAVEMGQSKTRQNIYGAIRFLPAPYSSFQLIRATVEPPDPKMLEDAAAVVRSFE